MSLAWNTEINGFFFVVLNLVSLSEEDFNKITTMYFWIILGKIFFCPENKARFTLLQVKEVARWCENVASGTLFLVRAKKNFTKVISIVNSDPCQTRLIIKRLQRER